MSRIERKARVVSHYGERASRVVGRRDAVGAGARMDCPRIGGVVRMGGILLGDDGQEPALRFPRRIALPSTMAAVNNAGS